MCTKNVLIFLLKVILLDKNQDRSEINQKIKKEYKKIEYKKKI